MHNIRKREEAKRSEAEGLAAQIAGKTVVIEAKAGDTGKLFGSVTSGMVADALADQFGIEVDRKRLDLHGHIKTVGDHAIDVRVYQDVAAALVLKVVPIGGVVAPSAEAQVEQFEAEVEAEAEAAEAIEAEEAAADDVASEDEEAAGDAADSEDAQE